MPAVEKGGGDFGSKMRRAREERGVSLRRIAEVTKISVTALEALERNDISRLPGGLFSRSFVRSYAIEIGLDPDKTVQEFLTRFPDDSLAAGSRHAPPDYDLNPDEPRRRRLSGVVITVILLALIIGAIVFFMFGRP